MQLVMVIQLIQKKYSNYYVICVERNFVTLSAIFNNIICFEFIIHYTNSLLDICNYFIMKSFSYQALLSLYKKNNFGSFSENTLARFLELVISVFYSL